MNILLKSDQYSIYLPYKLIKIWKYTSFLLFCIFFSATVSYAHILSLFNILQCFTLIDIFAFFIVLLHFKLIRIPFCHNAPAKSFGRTTKDPQA